MIPSRWTGIPPFNARIGQRITNECFGVTSDGHSAYIKRPPNQKSPFYARSKNPIGSKSRVNTNVRKQKPARSSLRTNKKARRAHSAARTNQPRMNPGKQGISNSEIAPKNKMNWGH